MNRKLILDINIYFWNNFMVFLLYHRAINIIMNRLINFLVHTGPTDGDPSVCIHCLSFKSSRFVPGIIKNSEEQVLVTSIRNTLFFTRKYTSTKILPPSSEKSEMEDHRVTYTEVKIRSPSRLQRTPEMSETKSTTRFEYPDVSTSLLPWKLTAVVLSLVCLSLLLSVGFLVKQIAESNSRNLTFSEERDPKELISGNSETQQPPTKASRCQPCDENWQQHGKYCYSFSRNLIPWRDCQRYCSESRSSFLKLNVEEELRFLARLSKRECHMNEKNLGISLYFNSSQMKWAWLDGSAFTLDKLGLNKPNNTYNQCKFIRNARLIDGSCEEHVHCMCKKTTYGH
ncbi:natural killer cells antigen CD94-like [Ochotona curzoniae]|uniref:natural killer cells antigen CD94-like n=1 Tax=Ochotona curzoniae TaxID=130825 RepID=UPI001B34F51F|nr:natural killer cells antigen CD94-like [Ochotona curzoniae]